MDRDSRWDRTKRAYDAIVHGEGLRARERAGRRPAGLRARRDRRVHPADDRRRAARRSRDGDSVLTFNFRPDRMRQIVRALGEPDFDEFDRAGFRGVQLTTMTRYQEDWDYPVAFPPARPEITLAAVLAERGDRQLHVAETEKYAARHVLLQRRGGAPVSGRGALPRAVAARRPHLRPQAGDERAGGGAASSSGTGARRPREGQPVPVRDHQLREPGHGRPHRQHPGRHARGRDRRSLPRRGGRGGAGAPAARRS